MTTINRQLNLVIPIIREDGTTIYVHSTPIRSETFEFYYLVLAKTWSAFLQNSLDPRTAPSVAALVLKETAKTTTRYPGVNWWDGSDGVGGESGLLAEVTRLSNVIAPDNSNGWSTTTLRDAIDRSIITAEEKSEVMNLLVFFTVASLMPPKPDRKTIINGMGAIYELQITSFNSTAFATSLKTSNREESIGENPQA